MRRVRARPAARAAVIALLAAASVAFGFLFDALCRAVERRMYPTRYEDAVTEHAERCGVPPELVFAVIRTASRFDSGKVSESGAVGLMQLTPDVFRRISDDRLSEHLDSGLMYDPETSIRYGAYLLGSLRDRYGDWETALAAYRAGQDRVDGWLKDPELANGRGGLASIPSGEARRFVRRTLAAQRRYERLYGDRFAGQTPRGTEGTNVNPRDRKV